ncbi:hypothetical protein LPB140_02890 [Sphingorhabdus lutea]|uniref:BD-FAE-like domain-containing protein n=1 Tax=Sphingorhabdus lutea TaxID=1913578 RepID=A0A1L3J9Y5_9SPHN|nr:alpha/beta hydrolase [Sphingorhabdus lutea]APG61945.1 hypothetical protein LPB140_02890 [Sphingorhabdus lutea]
MIKNIFLLLAIIAVGVGIWFYTLSGPMKLNMADKAWPAELGMIKSVQTINYGDDSRQKLDIYQIADAKVRVNGQDNFDKKPVLIFFHGGSWYHGEREGYAYIARAFAKYGIMTVIADYRKYPDVQFPDFVNDSAAAIKWTRQHIAKYGGDPDNITISGHSAGAHLSMLAILDPKYMGDITYIRGVIGIAGPYDFYPFTSDSAKNAMGHWPKPAETQPINYTRADAPPMLLLSGDNDKLVSPRNSKSLAAALQEKGAKAEVKIYPQMDHYEIIMAIALPFRGKGAVLDDMAAFINRK